MAPCSLLDGLKGRLQEVRDKTLKTKEELDVSLQEPPKPFFILKKLGAPPALLESPELKDSSGQLQAIAQQGKN